MAKCEYYTSKSELIQTSQITDLSCNFQSVVDKLRPVLVVFGSICGGCYQGNNRTSVLVLAKLPYKSVVSTHLDWLLLMAKF